MTYDKLLSTAPLIVYIKAASSFQRSIKLPSQELLWHSGRWPWKLPSALRPFACYEQHMLYELSQNIPLKAKSQSGGGRGWGAESAVRSRNTEWNRSAWKSEQQMEHSKPFKFLILYTRQQAVHHYACFSSCYTWEESLPPLPLVIHTVNIFFMKPKGYFSLGLFCWGYLFVLNFF